MINTIFAIGLGGALGALARHFAHTGIVVFLKYPFPFGTLAVNVVGSLIMGVLIAWFVQVWNPSQAVKLFLLTGFLGGFTTFSTFSLDMMGLIEGGDMRGALLYTVLSFTLSVAAIFLGSFLVFRFTA